MTTLHAVAHGNALNIGTADYLVSEMDPNAVKPGELINWIKRFDTNALNQKIDALEDLLEPLENVANRSTLEELEQEWSGTGGTAFQLRADQFIGYIGDDQGLGRRSILTEQIQAMKQLRNDIQALYDGCTKDVERHLSNVRQEYVSALCQDADGAAVTAMLNGAATGAGIGSAASGYGTAAGMAIGAVIGLINGFNASNEARIEAITGATTSLRDLTASINDAGNALALKMDGSSGLTLDAKEFKPDSDVIKGDWNDEILDEWETK